MVIASLASRNPGISIFMFNATLVIDVRQRNLAALFDPIAQFTAA
jgi:hypothetical protein